MKKSLIALAVLGSFAGVAAAQSSVTIYGIVDMAVSKANTGDSNLSYNTDWQVGNRNQWVMHPGTSSRLGFRGSEDLGGGLKANFLLEHRFTPDTGATETRDGVSGTASARVITPGFWNAQSYVGLSGGFGEIRLGRNYTPHFAYVALATDPWGYDFNLAGLSGFTRGGNAVTTTNNSVNYLSPNLGGLTFQLGVGAGEGAAAAVGQAVPNGRNVGGAVQYAAGPLWVGFGYNDSKRSDATKNQSMVFGLTYDLGVVKPMFNYSVGKNNLASNARTKTMVLGALVPVGNGLIRTGVARFDPAVGFNTNASPFSPYFAVTPAPTNSQNTTKFGIGYVYNLSKRTSVSADIGTSKTETYSRSTGYQAGLKHVF